MTNYSKLLIHTYSNHFRELYFVIGMFQIYYLKQIHLGYFSKFKSLVHYLLNRDPSALQGQLILLFTSQQSDLYSWLSWSVLKRSHPYLSLLCLLE